MAKKIYKQHIPSALRQATWLHHNGQVFSAKCNVTWCKNVTTPFTFEVGHNVPECRGGTLDIDNLRPICSCCNRSMGFKYTIDEFSSLSTRAEVAVKKGSCFLACFRS